MKYVFATSCLLFVLSACAPSAVVQTTALRLAPTATHEGFLVVKETETFNAPATELGIVEIEDKGFALNCDYETVVELATTEARKLGANVLKIYEHRLPSIWGSTCHRIKAKALRVGDLTPFEKEIVWHPGRRLKQADFKASTESRPFEAATSSGVRYRYLGRMMQGTVKFTVETVFDCHASYFKGKQNPTLTLAHEQGHFDITEIAARRFTKAIQEQVANTKELESKQEEIYRQTIADIQLLQDKYDSEVYADRSKQAPWLLKIEQELNALQAYAAKEITIKIKV